MGRCPRVIAAILFFACSAAGMDPNRALPQYIRNKWSVQQGFPGGTVYAIAEGLDGYLWIGAENGLVRFDGVNFRVFGQASPTTFSIGAVQELMADGAGDLWILLQSTKILRYHDGKFELGREEAEFGITSVSRRRDGSPLLSSLAYGALHYRAGKYESLTPSAYLASSALSGTAELGDNLSTRLSWAEGVVTHRLAEPNSAVISMAETADGKIWLGPPPFDHSKLMTIDGEWSLIGSPNMDMRSLRLNFELAVELYDPELAGRLAEIIDARRIQPITLDDIDGRRFIVKLRDAAARLAMPYI